MVLDKGEIDSISNDAVLSGIKNINDNMSEIKSKLIESEEKIQKLTDKLALLDIGEGSSLNDGLSEEFLQDSEVDMSTTNPEQNESFVEAMASGKKVYTVIPTKDQKLAFENLKMKLDDPIVIQNLSMQDLVNTDEMKRLPEALRYVILTMAMKNYKNGGVSKEVFFPLLISMVCTQFST